MYLINVGNYKYYSFSFYYKLTYFTSQLLKCCYIILKIDWDCAFILENKGINKRCFGNNNIEKICNEFCLYLKSKN